MSDVQIMPEMAESRDGPREGAITSRHGDARWRGYESRVKEFTPPLSVFFLPSATVVCILASTTVVCILLVGVVCVRGEIGILLLGILVVCIICIVTIVSTSRS